MLYSPESHSALGVTRPQKAYLTLPGWEWLARLGWTSDLWLLPHTVIVYGNWQRHFKSLPVVCQIYAQTGHHWFPCCKIHESAMQGNQQEMRYPLQLRGKRFNHRISLIEISHGSVHPSVGKQYWVIYCTGNWICCTEKTEWIHVQCKVWILNARIIKKKERSLKEKSSERQMSYTSYFVII